MDQQLPQELADLVARTVLSAYNALPLNGKPRSRSNGAHEWTVLAGFCLYEPTDQGGFTSRCVTLGTGLKVLPHSKLPIHGDVLHDSHAEVIARRGLKLWLFDQLEKAYTQDPSAALKRDATGVWVLRPGLHLALYISTLPCGDASTYSLSLGVEDREDQVRSADQTVKDYSCLPSTMSALSLGLSTSRASTEAGLTVQPQPESHPTPVVHRGRVNYAARSTLRTKPGRLDSPPTTSHSCSDKLASWALTGLQGSLLAALGVGRVPLTTLVIGGGVDQDPHGRAIVHEEVCRAVGDRVWRDGWTGPSGQVALTPDVCFVNSLDSGLVFEHARDVVARTHDCAEADLVSCPESISFVEDRGTEILVNGARQGASVKRKPGEALSVKSRSRLCKLSLFERYNLIRSGQVQAKAKTETASPYYEVKQGTENAALKRAARSSGGPLEGWIVSGRTWENFDSYGRLCS